MKNFKRIVILVFAALFLITGIIALGHSHPAGAFQGKDKDHCSVCAYIFTINSAIVILFVFMVNFPDVIEKVIKKQVSVLVRKYIFLPPSLAPPVIA